MLWVPKDWKHEFSLRITAFYYRLTARTEIHACTNNGADGKLRLVDGEDDTSKMGWSNFVDVQLRESQEPADRNPWIISAVFRIQQASMRTE
jgi:hypothetical protein